MKKLAEEYLYSIEHSPHGPGELAGLMAGFREDCLGAYLDNLGWNRLKDHLQAQQVTSMDQAMVRARTFSLENPIPKRDQLTKSIGGQPGILGRGATGVVECYNCGRRGHLSRDCRSPRVQGPGMAPSVASPKGPVNPGYGTRPVTQGTGVATQAMPILQGTRCYNCNQMGHTARFWPIPRSGPGPSTQVAGVRPVYSDYYPIDYGQG